MIHGVTVYVLGFMFSTDHTRVALIRKIKPDWQRNRLNGIGGKVEIDERPIDAMTREFTEETGLVTSNRQWKNFATLVFFAIEVECYVTVGPLNELRTMTDETVEIHDIASLQWDSQQGNAMIENLPWLIPLARNTISGGPDPRPNKARIQYL